MVWKKLTLFVVEYDDSLVNDIKHAVPTLEEERKLV
jgi:hypothetical protein